MSDRWDVHEHKDELRVSSAATVFHLERGQLCYYDVEWNCILYYPITFRDRPAAYKWIQSGTIAELQRSLGILNVGFSKNCLTEK